MDAYEAIASRRSLRQLDGRAVPRELIDKLLYVACRAPAPHHTRPWRFVVIESQAARRRLADRMGAAWRRDLERDGVPSVKVDALLAKSRMRIEEAPALLLASLVRDGLRDWPDEQRQRAEWGMAQQSLGCALQNIMLAAHALGLSSYWISAPLFAPDAVREALDLPSEHVAQALIVVGYPQAGVSPGPRPEADVANMVERR